MSIYKAEWAYDFICDLTLEEIRDSFNKAGPWEWQLRENYIQGWYLNVRPFEGVRLQIHEYPQAFIKGPRNEGFSTLIRIEGNSQYEKEEIDAVLQRLFHEIKVTDIKEIEPYD